MVKEKKSISKIKKVEKTKAKPHHKLVGKVSKKEQKPKISHKKQISKSSHVKHRLKETFKREEFLKLVTIVFSILSFIMLVLIIFTFLSDSNVSNSKDNKYLIPMENVSENETFLYIIEDKTCITCIGEAFANQIKSQLIPDLKFKIGFTNQSNVLKLMKNLNKSSTPIYIFSKNIQNLKDWDTIKNKFIKVNIENQTFFFLNPDLTPFKTSLEETPILNDAVVIGNKNAKLTIYEFTDFECPFCAIAYGEETLTNQLRIQNENYTPSLVKVYSEYIETGKVKLVFYNFPIEKIHPNSKYVHNTALCAGEENKFNEFSKKLFLNRSEWINQKNKTEIFKKYAKELGLDIDKFQLCTSSNKFFGQIEEEIKFGKSIGIEGTPTFFIGKTQITGSQDFGVFKSIIEKQLN